MDDQLKNILTVSLAAYAAVISTTVLIWDLYKWRYAERVRLEVSATPGFVMTNDPYKRKFIHVSVTNIGKIKTTIKLISLHGFNSKRELKKKRNGENVSIMLNPEYGKLPVTLEPGDDWACGFVENFDGIEKYLEYPIFVVQINDTMSRFPFHAEVDKQLLAEDLKKQFNVPAQTRR
jgi:hypothetical protein